ncbi:MAG: hypothetical protein LBL24_11640 [Bacteroidales bacterium]|jgi:hypothetical protein|nr:hypothetical protein [Bacteroidales bacterium]
MSTFNHAEFVKKLEDNAREILDYAGNEAPRILGNTAKNFFMENFQQEGFVNGGLRATNEKPLPISSKNSCK